MKIKCFALCTLILCFIMSGCMSNSSTACDELSIYDEKNNLQVWLGQNREDIPFKNYMYLGNSCLSLEFFDDKVCSISISQTNSEDSLWLHTKKGSKVGDTRDDVLDLYGEPDETIDIYGKDNLYYFYALLDGKCIRLDSEAKLRKYQDSAVSIQFLIDDEDIVSCISVFQKNGEP